MKKITNPFVKLDNHYCFCCSNRNPIGLKLEFWLDEEEEMVFTNWEPSRSYQGYPNVLHGGIQSTLMDEVASWAVYILLQTAGFTTKIDIKIKKPVHIDKGALKVTAKVISTEKKISNILTKLYDSEGTLCSEGIIQYYIYPQQTAIEKLDYPGFDAFFPNPG